MGSYLRLAMGLGIVFLSGGCGSSGGGAGAGELIGSVASVTGSSGTSSTLGGVDGQSMASADAEHATLHNPEPGSVALFGAGLASLALARRRGRKRAVR